MDGPLFLLDVLGMAINHRWAIRSFLLDVLGMTIIVDVGMTAINYEMPWG